jgi:phage tail-like protein
MSVLGSYPSFGMSMRFSVEVKGLDTSSDLGLWQSCSQLEIDLNCEKFAQGGVNLKDKWLPGDAEYSDVTLKRPMEKKSSSKVQAWLQKFVKGWENYEGAPYGSDPQTDSVIITLLDHRLDTVTSWTLKNARPVKWLGPELSADGKNVAVETLVIQHDGFLEHGEVKSADQATLTPKEKDDGEPVTFYFNPTKMTIEHASATESSSGDNTDPNICGVTKLSLSIPELRLAGPKTLADCEQLLEWTYPHPTKPNYLPPLTFKWGEFKIRKKDVEVILTKANITYERFDSEGRPTRALVSIDLEYTKKNSQEQQNPTSGGLPGREGHAMVSGETLAGIALGTYGSPARWRAVAAANQIDDPLRVRPGSMLLLPSRAELARLAEGGAA